MDCLNGMHLFIRLRRPQFQSCISIFLVVRLVASNIPLISPSIYFISSGTSYIHASTILTGTKAYAICKQDQPHAPSDASPPFPLPLPLQLPFPFPFPPGMKLGVEFAAVGVDEAGNPATSGKSPTSTPILGAILLMKLSQRMNALRLAALTAPMACSQRRDFLVQRMTAAVSGAGPKVAALGSGVEGSGAEDDKPSKRAVVACMR